LSEAIEKALDLGDGLVIAARAGEIQSFSAKKAPDETAYSQLFACSDCGVNLPELEPRDFSFNSPHGACEECSGLGVKLEIDPELILNPNLTLAQGAIKPWPHIGGEQTLMMRLLGEAADRHGFDLNTAIKDLSKKQIDIILYGENSVARGRAKIAFAGETGAFEGIIPILERRHKQTDSDYTRKEIENYMRVLVCPACRGRRLKPEILGVKVGGLSICEITEKTIADAKDFFAKLEKSKDLSARDKKISGQILKEINTRLEFLLNVGLDYLTLARSAATLSGGEAQRIRLATQIGSGLTGVLYILDEPSIGLHQRDNDKLIGTLRKLRDLGNTVIVVEHDEAMMLCAERRPHN